MSLLFVLIATGVGIFARLWDLPWHFANVDDMGVAEIILKNRLIHEWGFFPIPRFYTYAPFQFFFTPFLISDHATYRELLFWGRLPSCLFSILGLACLAFFYTLFEKSASGKKIFALSLLACSWQVIAHAKQMHNYALGVTAVVLLFTLLALNLSKERLSLKGLLLNALALVLLGTMHYQILIFIPAFFLAIFLKEKATSAEINSCLIKKYAISGILFMVGIFPVWWLFLRRHLGADAGMQPAGRGAGNEFVLSFLPNTGWIQNAVHAFFFYLKNFFLVFQAHTAFLPENHFLYGTVSWILFMGLLGGAWRLMEANEPLKRYFGLFLAASFLTWLALVGMQKLTFGPSRHTMLLLPFFIIVIAEGASGFFEFLIRRFQISVSPFPFLSASAFLVLAIFILNFPVFLRERRDPFEESRILELLQKYQVSMVFTNDRSDGLNLMKSVKDYRAKAAQGPAPFRTVAWISHRDMGFANLAECEKVRGYLNRTAAKKAPYSCQDYALIYSERRPSTAQVDFSRRIQVPIYTNGFYFYVVRAVEKKAGP